MISRVQTAAIQNIIYVEICRGVGEEELISVNRSHHIIRSDGLREVKPE